MTKKKENILDIIMKMVISRKDVIINMTKKKENILNIMILVILK
jgi:hypothetical protein